LPCPLTHPRWCSTGELPRGQTFRSMPGSRLVCHPLRLRRKFPQEAPVRTKSSRWGLWSAPIRHSHSWLFADEGVAVGRRSGRWGPPVLLVARSLGARLVFRGASEATLLMSPLQVNDELRDVEAEVMSRSSKRLR